MIFEHPDRPISVTVVFYHQAKGGIMSKFLISIIGTLIIGEAFATGENIPTSKGYVDAAVAEKQDKISANNGATQVLTNTGTAGEYGTKEIYNSANAYGEQTDALIDAVTMNTAVQNAIDSEFQCVEWVDNDPTKDCLLMDVFGSTGRSTKNLLDPSFTIKSTYRTITVNGKSFERARILPTENGKTYTLSATLDYNGTYYYYLYYVLPNGTADSPSTCSYMWNNYHGEQNGTRRKTCTFTAQDNGVYVVYFATAQSLNTLTLSNYQMEEGSTATPYEPYSNLYIPSAE